MNTVPIQSEPAGRGAPNGARNPLGPPASRTKEPDRAAVARELELILASRFFQGSKRSQQFLQYVVQYRLGGNEEPLKERTIGADLYKRPADYATGDDAVVRVHAGEVRRRLEQYYLDPPAGSLVLIDLPLGSYAPEFRWASASPQTQPSSDVSGPGPIEAVSVPQQDLTPVRGGPRRRPWILVLACVLAGAAILFGFGVYQKKSADAALRQFWSPVFASAKPLFICLPKTVLYRPSIELYRRSAQSPGEFDSEVERMNGRPHLNPDQTIRWGDIPEYGDFGMGKGDVEAAFRLTRLMSKLGKDTELRIGSDYGWDDLHNAPAVVIGGFSNPWAMKITSGLHFSFVEPQPGKFTIQEQGPKGRTWFVQLDPKNIVVGSDYGLISRLVKSSTGQFVICIAGITAPGSEAAAEVASSQAALAEALRSAPPDWYRKNVQIVVKTSVVDAVAGPPEIVAVYVW